MLVRALEAKDRYTAGHAERVADYARLIGQELRFTPARLERLRFAALMHDIGKLVVPNHLLNKPGKLTAEEFARVRTHEEVSAEMLSHIDFLAPVAHSSLSEHMVYQPDDAKHPIEPYIVMVADAYDAMTSTRSYRQALPHDVAIAELRDKAGDQFHPECTDALDPRPRTHRQGPRGRRGRDRAALGRHASRGGSRVGRARRPASRRCAPRAPRARRRGARAMRVRRRIAWVVVGSIIAAATVQIAQPHSTTGGAVLLAAGAVLGELLVLRLDDGTGLPLSYAVLLVLVSCFEPAAVAALVVGAELVAIAVRVEPRRVPARVPSSRCNGSFVAAGALGAYRVRPPRVRDPRPPRCSARRARGHRRSPRSSSTSSCGSSLASAVG